MARIFPLMGSRLMMAVVVACVAFSSCTAAPLGVVNPPDSPAGVIAPRLERAFPELATLGLVSWRDQDWCQFITYSRGTFAASDSPSTCNLRGSNPRPFDDQARADLDRVRILLDGPGVDIYIANLETSDGAVTDAGFDMTCARCETRGLRYQPGHDVVSDQDREERLTRVDANWWMWEVNVSPG